MKKNWISCKRSFLIKSKWKYGDTWHAIAIEKNGDTILFLDPQKGKMVDDSFYFLINERLFGENKFYVSIDKKSCSEKKLSHEEAREIRPNRFKAIELDK